MNWWNKKEVINWKKENQITKLRLQKGTDRN